MNWRQWRRRDEDLDRELRNHLELEAEELRQDGLPGEQARLAARRALGNLTITKEEVRGMWGWTRWEALFQDLRHAARGLRKAPGFAIAAILTLALGIGASTAVFTVVDSVILEPLSYRESSRLVVAWEHIRSFGGDPVGPNPRHAELWRQRTGAFEGLSLFRHNVSAGVSLGSGSARPTPSVICEPNLFRVLRVTPILGRDFLPADGRGPGSGVAILTWAGWQSLFQGDPRVIGKTIRVDGGIREIVGVLPGDFHFPSLNVLRAFPSAQPRSGALDPQLFLPFAFELDRFGWNSDYGNWVALGRLAPGISLREATARLNGVQEQLWREMPSGQGDRTPGAWRATLEPMQEAMIGESRSGLWLLLGAVGALLAIACLNLANAQLGRALSRRRDAALRVALGAAKGRLLWNALAENSILAGVGGVLGIALAWAAVALFRAYSPVDLPRLAEVKVNGAALLFSAAATIAVTAAVGLLPALRNLRTDPRAALQQSGSRTIGSSLSQRMRTGLMGLQVLGSTVLLLATGLFAKSLLHLLSQDMGFETAHAAVAEVRLFSEGYRDSAKRVAFIDGVLERLRSAPGIQSAGFVSAMPLEGESWIESVQRLDRPDLKGPMVNARWAGPGYFEAMRHRLIAGRFFEERDRSLNSIVISEGEAKALWGNESAVGGEIKVLGKTFQVIGVVGDARSTSLKTPPARIVYAHYAYRTPSQAFFVARGTAGGSAVSASLREAIQSHAPNATVTRVKSLDAQVSDSLARERIQTLVLTAFGGSALLLAMLGIYGVLSYSVAARTQEFGVRAALGATRGTIYRETMMQAAMPVAFGLIGGLAGGIAAGKLVEKFLYGAKAFDTTVILGVVVVLGFCAMIAAFVPARRAGAIDPVAALRAE